MTYSKQTSPFLNRVGRAIRIRRLSQSTENSYMHYTTDSTFFYGKPVLTSCLGKPHALHFKAPDVRPLMICRLARE
jgi:hypothetical protein